MENPVMDGTLWSRLPEDLIARVFAWLPLASVVRLRAVCRKWGQLVATKSFMEAFSQVASYKPYFVKSSKRKRSPLLRSFDPSRKRWCNISISYHKPTVAINNPSLVALDIMVDDKNVRVTTEFATLDINHPEQQIQISVGGGENMEVTVGDGDVIVVVAFPTGAANPQAFKPVAGGEEPLQPDDVAAGERPLTSRKVLPAPLPHANEPWPEMRP